VKGVWQPPVWLLNWGWMPKWSPDGKVLHFGSGISRGSLWLMSADSGATPRLLVDSAGPHGLMGVPGEWTPDGRAVYVRSLDADGRTQLWLVPLASGIPQLLISFDGVNLGPARGGWAVSAGQFLSAHAEEKSDVWVIEARKP
jgi:WD40-like Beta Propeller Repeat